MLKAASYRLKVLLIGQIDHADFGEAAELLRADAELTVTPDITLSITDLANLQPQPELIVIMQGRPDAIGALQVKRLQRAAPLSGIVAILGSWCEGHGRTGRPWPGTTRLYWHEFGPWWRRQLVLRANGQCPDWARMEDFRLHSFSIRNPQSAIRNQEASQGLVFLAVPRWETSDALGDVFARAGYASVWQPRGMNRVTVRGTVAGVWEGGQVDEQEAGELAAFCSQLAKEHAPVIALLDFPRRDSIARALEAGAAAVMGKPWWNESLVESLGQCIERTATTKKAPRAA